MASYIKHLCHVVRKYIYACTCIVQYRVFKQCSFVLQNMSRTQCENIFAQASFSPPVWEKALMVIEYEDGKLKKQKLSKKGLISKPEFKQHHFQCLHNLIPSVQLEVLEQVVGREITLDKANEFRAIQNIRRAFTKCTNTTWEEARERFPWHTTDDQLSSFLGLNFVKNVPDAFWSYCQSAVRGECQPGNDHLVYQGAKATVVQLKISEFTIADLQRSIPKYSGYPQGLDYDIMFVQIYIMMIQY